MYKLNRPPTTNNPQREKSQNSQLGNLINQSELKIISAWRYPGVSPERDPIPADILREIARGLEESELAEEMAE